MSRSALPLLRIAALAGVAALAQDSADAFQLGGDPADRGSRAEGRRPRAQAGTRQRPGSLDRGLTPPSERGASTFGASVDDIYPFGYPAERRQRLYFTMTDADHGEWISFREAREALRFDASRFRAFDVDNDGRMTFEEFSSFVLSEAAAGRVLPEPITRPLTGAPPPRTAEQLRSAYDVDLDGAISGLELDRMLGDYQTTTIERADGTEMLIRLDTDGSDRLELAELERLSAYLLTLAEREPGSPPVPEPGARSVLEMFGEPTWRGETVPHRIVGPVPPFHRLDVDGDGFVDIEDLEALEGRTFAPVRLRSVLNTLDVDYDGRLSEAEFLSSMTRKPR